MHTHTHIYIYILVKARSTSRHHHGPHGPHLAYHRCNLLTLSTWHARRSSSHAPAANLWLWLYRASERHCMQVSDSTRRWHMVYSPSQAPHSAQVTPRPKHHTPHKSQPVPNTTLRTSHTPSQAPHSTQVIPRPKHHTTLRTSHTPSQTPHSTQVTPRPKHHTPHKSYPVPNTTLRTSHTPSQAPHSAQVIPRRLRLAARGDAWSLRHAPHAAMTRARARARTQQAARPHPASLKPLSTMASAISLMRRSLTQFSGSLSQLIEHRNRTQAIHPIMGVLPTPLSRASVVLVLSRSTSPGSTSNSSGHALRLRANAIG